MPFLNTRNGPQNYLMIDLLESYVTGLWLELATPGLSPVDSILVKSDLAFFFGEIGPHHCMMRTLTNVQFGPFCIANSGFLLSKYKRTHLTRNTYLLKGTVNAFRNSVVQGQWAATWQNQQSECAPNEDSDQPGRPPSLIRVFVVRSVGSLGPKLSSGGQRRLWSDWADTQADLRFRWAHNHFACFVMSRLKYVHVITNYLHCDNVV